MGTMSSPKRKRKAEASTLLTRYMGGWISMATTDTPTVARKRVKAGSGRRNRPRKTKKPRSVMIMSPA